jgi:hypothetical protein
MPDCVPSFLYKLLSDVIAGVFRLSILAASLIFSSNYSDIFRLSLSVIGFFFCSIPDMFRLSMPVFGLIFCSIPDISRHSLLVSVFSFVIFHLFSNYYVSS